MTTAPARPTSAATVSARVRVRGASRPHTIATTPTRQPAAASQRSQGRKPEDPELRCQLHTASAATATGSAQPLRAPLRYASHINTPPAPANAASAGASVAT